jgi:hypothetical protein
MPYEKSGNIKCRSAVAIRETHANIPIARTLFRSITSDSGVFERCQKSKLFPPVRNQGRVMWHGFFNLSSADEKLPPTRAIAEIRSPPRIEREARRKISQAGTLTTKPGYFGAQNEPGVPRHGRTFGANR